MKKRVIILISVQIFLTTTVVFAQETWAIGWWTYGGVVGSNPQGGQYQMISGGVSGVGSNPGGMSGGEYQQNPGSGSAALTFTPTPTPTFTPTNTATNTATNTSTMTFTLTSSITPGGATLTPSLTPSLTFTATETSTPTLTFTPTDTETPTPSITPGGPTLTPTRTPTLTPSITPGGPTLTATRTFTLTPSITPGGATLTPTFTLTFIPSITPGGATLTAILTATITITPNAATKTVIAKTGTATVASTATMAGFPTLPSGSSGSVVTNPGPLRILIYVDLNGDRIMNRGEGINNLLVLIRTSDGKWSGSGYTKDGELIFNLPPSITYGVDVMIDVPYLYRTGIIKVQPGFINGEIILDAPVFPAELP